MMKRVVVAAAALLIGTWQLFAQIDKPVIINEIANSGAKKAMYTGGEYVELLVVKPGGLTMAGWYLTDLGSPTGTAKENEGSIRLSDADGSVFKETIPQGTYILICLGDKDDPYGGATVEDDVSLTDNNNRIVVFAYASPKHIVVKDGRMAFTGKDNVALLSDWKKDGAVDVVAWEGSSSWTGCNVTLLPIEAGENGKIMYFAPKGRTVKGFGDNANAQLWTSTSEVSRTTPGATNPDVDDSVLKTK